MLDRQIESLAAALRRPLPGAEAQRLLAPGLSFGRHFAPPPDGARRAAVVVLLYPGPDGLRLPLIVRPESLEHHPGQIGLPGGQIETGESSWDAAIRELDEELGVGNRHGNSAAITPLGQLTPLYVFASNHFVSAWVAALAEAPKFAPNPSEVAELFELPLTHLCDLANRGQHRRTIHGAETDVPHIAWGTHQIWGATAMILAELAAVFEAVLEE